MLKITNLHAKRSGKEILHGVDLELRTGEIHALMGPNGSGKSTLALAISGHPEVEVADGSVVLGRKNITDLDVEKKAKLGLFLAFQYPVEIPGVPYLEFLRLASGSKLSPFRFKKYVEEEMGKLGMDVDFLNRNLNEGFSGGEKKKSEILQMAILRPRFAILDETDSGLDVSALKIVGETTRKIARQNKMGVLVITHYNRILNYLKPSHVHVMIKGKIVDQGGMKLAQDLEKTGYDKYL